MSLLIILASVLLGALVNGQESCPTNLNPCANGGTCFLKPDGATTYCYCPENYEGENCDKFNRPRTGCVLTQRNFYGQKEGFLTSPHYPADYPKNQYCAYFIGTPDAKKFELTFHDLSFEKGKDELSIGTGDFVDLRRYDELYDKQAYEPLPGPITLEGDRLWFNFLSDLNRNYKGFNVSWRIDGDECIGDPCGATQTCVDAEYGYTCEAAQATLIGEGGDTGGEGGTNGLEGGAGGAGTDGGLEGSGAGGGDGDGPINGPTDGMRSCTIENQEYPHGYQWDMTPCSYCNCNDGVGKCEFRSCPALRCRIPIKDASVCCHECPPQRFFTTGVTYRWGSASGSIISHRNNEMIVNVDVDYDKERSSEMYGDNLWKVGMYTKMKAEAGGDRISVSEQILDHRKENKKLVGGANLKFHKLKYNLDLTGRRCEDIEEVCVEFGKGDNPDPDYELVPEPNPDILTTCAPVECPPPPVGLTCFDDAGAEYQDGQEWRMDDCTTCTCHSGQSDCITQECPLLECTETRAIKGQCCPQCLVEELGTCMYEGVKKATGTSWPISDCVTCHCDEGSISCDFFECQCPVPPEEKDNCGPYKHGQTWFEDNCVKCTCNQTKITCEGITCPLLECDETVHGETECCPRCKGDPSLPPLPCLQGDQIYYHGQQWKLTNCIDCICSNGFVSCAGASCSPVYCENPEVAEGECCMTCPGKPGMGLPCVHDKRFYQHGSSWQVDPCTTCSCENAIVGCEGTICDVPVCPVKLVQDPDKCCPYCTEEPEFCTQQGVDYLEGATWKPNPCLNCSCSGGIVDCREELCPPLVCFEYEQDPDECCPTCGPGERPACLYEGKKYAEGETFKTNPCTSCNCRNRLVTCVATACIAPFCSVPLVHLPDQCCPICPDLHCVDLVTGQRVENGGTFKPSACKSCTCTDGVSSCITEQCRELDPKCRSSYTPVGECCPVCTDGPPVSVDEYPCVDGDTMRVHGQQWRPDPCQVCTCNNGTTFCSGIDCALPCPNPTPPIAGECCGSCPEDPPCIDNGNEYDPGDKWRRSDCESCECVRGETLCIRKTCPPLDCEPVTVPGVCCPVCIEPPHPPCVFKGNNYTSGDQFKKDDCTTCHCIDGHVECVETICDFLTCPNPILRAGKCCLECQKTPCITKSGFYVHGDRWDVDECTTCTCEQGVVSCETQVCPIQDCPNTEDLPGACCDNCVGDTPCEYEGKRYVAGQRVKTANPCLSCICNADGIVLCLPPSCPRLTCNDPIRVEGQCCAKCEGDVCEYQGKEYPVGKRFEPDPCTTCECLPSLRVMCSQINCDVPNCPEPVILEGACCPTCPDFCRVGSKVYADGSRFQLDACSHCTCRGGAVGCVGTPCSPPPCAPQFYQLLPGDCCETCAEPPPSCSFYDQSYPEGARWRASDCRDCWCQDERTWCADITCFRDPDCNAMAKVEGQCCPVCTDPPHPPGRECTSEKGLTYQDGSRWYTTCGYCTCHDSVITCVTEFCPQLTCENQVKPDGACCAVCAEEPKSCSLAGNTYQHRQVFRINECVDCMCYESDLYCWGRVCPRPACDNPIKVPDKCCLQCPPDPVVGPRQDCVLPDQRSYSHGSFFKTDPCHYCFCNNGTPICAHEPCEAKVCDDQGEIIPKGECCSVCRSDIKKCVVGDVTYSHNDRWREGTCTECYCNSGVKRCEQLTCPDTSCNDPVTDEGACCPRCPGVPVCTEDGVEYTHGQGWRKDKCTTCTCIEGTIQCTYVPCPPLDCQDPVSVSGKCCRVCPDVANPCEIDGKIYKHGESFRGEGCQECVCNNGQGICQPRNCPALACSESSAFTVEGECCPECPRDKKVGCVLDGLRYVHGQKWPRGDCENCQCNDGQVECIPTTACPLLTCDNAVLQEGECCPKCPDKVRSCMVDGREVAHGMMVAVRDDMYTCRRCICNNGNVSCVTDDCPAADCDPSSMANDGCCNTCPDQPTCMYRGYEFTNGQIWQKDKCTFCQCQNGNIQCLPEVCPTLNCVESAIVQVEGECCPRCQAAPCDYGGTEYKDGESWDANECSRCSCDNGAISCISRTCSPVTCANPVTMPGRCCPECPDQRSCETPGGVFSHGETWRKNKCTTCSCTNGEDQCLTEFCPPLPCPDPRNVVGECCRQCPENTRPCEVDGVVYQHKEQWQPTPCDNCECNDGTESCREQTCPTLPCPEPLEIEGQCCPECPGPPTKPCIYKNQKYTDQQEWHPDVCTTCRCVSGIASCAGQSCPLLQCEQGDPVEEEGRCCRVCPALPCEYDGATYDHRQSWRDGNCRVCSCENGHVACSNRVCPKPDCDNPTTVEGKCCPQCPGLVPLRDCEYKNNFYLHGQRWKPEVCKECNCNDGRVTCKDTTCEEPLCSQDEQLVEEGKCCPVCPDQIRDCVDKAGNLIATHGQRQQTDDCTSCLCLNGEYTCTRQICPLPLCPDFIDVEGQCCHQCEGEPAERPKDSCVASGREYPHGDRWTQDECTECTCNDGDTHCNFQSCPRLTCEGTPIQIEGKCCPVCPGVGQYCTIGGRDYDHGASWEPSACTVCTCDNSQVTCKHEVCPKLACTETQSVEGQCCKQCKGEEPFKNCTYKGKDYKHGTVLRKNNCKKCTCEDGDWSCENELCPELTCNDPVHVEGQCCPKCPDDTKSCEIDGVTYKHREKYSTDPCLVCVCDNGNAICNHLNCPDPGCSNAVTLEGECCPTCPGVGPYRTCRRGNQKYKHGEWWSPSDCSQCTCLDGDIHCQVKTCPRPTCDNPVRKEGECCKKCPDQKSPCDLPDGGGRREHREKWRVDSCKTCKCYNGHVSCHTQTCPELHCMGAAVPENQCCPVCPGPPADGCTVKGKTYQHGERWDKNPCKSCLCDNGRVFCDSPGCDALDCTNPIKIPGECCLRCPDVRSCITPDNVEHPHGEKWHEGDCRICKCDNGRANCDDMRCPALTCSNPITIPDQCCKQCEGPPYESCTRYGQEYHHGERWDIKDTCTSCSCSNGVVDCVTPTCPTLTCSNPVKVKGQCCKVCPDVHDPCIASDGTRRKHGEEWKENDCVTCTCMDGTSNCIGLKCPALSCTPVVRNPGQCCPLCPTQPTPPTCHLKDGREFISGQSWRKGRCRTCACEWGNKVCDNEVCPVLTCSNQEKVGDECCKRCGDEIPTCLATGGVTYKHGETWQTGPCTTCECKEGTIICSDMLCPPPSCSNPVDVEGECCPQCPGVPPPKPCIYNHEIKAHGETWQPTPCKTCSCSNNRVDCESEICPTLTCADKVKTEGECCPKCRDTVRDCVSDTPEPFKHGDIRQVDPCTTCECYNADKACTTKACAVPDCPNPISLTNECCPRCPPDPRPAPCQYKGKEVAHGERWDINPCKFCQCSNGIVGCATETCPLLTCANSVKVPGECCRFCIDMPDPGCVVNGRQMQTGETFRQSVCSTCTCYFGSLECQLTVCPVPDCDNPVKAHDECCAHCPGVPKPRPCSHRGKTYRSGESWTKGPCKICTCNNGTVSCENEQCPHVDCANAKRYPDECCKRCPVEEPCTTGDGEVYDHATSFRRSDCETCSCENSVITCEKEVCPALDCAMPVSEEGKCCDRCPDVLPPKPCITKTGERMRHGRSWRETACKVCVCDNGNIRCDKETCPTLTCDQPMKRVAGECCRRCPPDPDNACSAEDGTTYLPGETWNPDLCTECRCTESGGVRCKGTPCPPLDCAEPIPVEGQCCMTCDPGPIIKPEGTCTATRKEGETWRPTPCAKCTCRNGEISCALKTCPVLDCTDLVKIPGDCCPRCSTAPKVCRDADGISRRQGEFWRPTNCEECTCDGGMTKCRQIDCTKEPACNDPESVAGQCCPVCPTPILDSCEISRNRRLNHGESIKVDDCRTCTCSNGRLDCIDEYCTALECAKTTIEKGQCCPVCQVAGCVHDGVTYRSGDSFEDPADKCLMCQCNDGDITCGQPGVACPAVECDVPIILEGDCCPSCIDGICSYENKLYQSGDKWEPSDCERCECFDGEVACTIEDCVSPPCSVDLIQIPGRCCAECPDDYRSCMDKDGMYNHGHKWIKPSDVCIECVCDDSAICCEHIKCPEPNCENTVVPPGQCCAVCNGNVLQECTHQNLIYQHGDVWEDGCFECDCTNGVVDCQRKGCPLLPCDNPVQIEGQCCPECGQPCIHRSIEHQHGASWPDPIQTCVICTCTNGEVSCGPQICPRLNCNDGRREAGECCPTCPDVSFGRARLQLGGIVNNYVLNFTIFVENTEKEIQGEDLWRVKLWSSSRPTGGGAKSNLIRQALNKRQASQTIGLGDKSLQFEDLEYIRDLGGLPCEAYRYVCAEFYMTKSGFDKYTTTTTFGEDIVSICLDACP